MFVKHKQKIVGSKRNGILYFQQQNIIQNKAFHCVFTAMSPPLLVFPQ